jgi:hypothetical protein
MAQYTDWFLADPAEAADLGVALPEELADGWEHVSLRDVLELEIEALSKVLCGPGVPYRPELLYPEDAAGVDGPSVTSEVMEGGVFVMQVPPTLVDALAALRRDDVGRVVQAWRARSEHLRELSEDEVARTLGEMRRFARRAVERGKAVLTVFEA